MSASEAPNNNKRTKIANGTRSTPPPRKKKLLRHQARRFHHIIPYTLAFALERINSSLLSSLTHMQYPLPVSLVVLDGVLR